jgi:anti-sigma B factor antagonist
MRDLQLQVAAQSGDRAVLRVSGEIDVYSAPALREQVIDLAAGGAAHVLIDLGEVEFLDSTGLGVLVGSLKRLRAKGGSLGLVISRENILRIFRITGLTKVFPPYATVSAAIAADPHWRKAAEDEAGGVEQWCERYDLD